MHHQKVRSVVLASILSTAVCISSANERTEAHNANEDTDAKLHTTDTAVCPRKQSVLSHPHGFCSLVLNDSSTRRTWGPWAYQPYCVAENRKRQRGKLGDRDSDLDGRRTRYCLFTNSYFGEHGISILARPEVAARAADILLDAYHSTFPSPETVQYLNLEPAYRVVDMPDKGGKGVIATRHIQRRETFMVDYAAIVGEVNIWGSISQKEGRPLLNRAAEQLIDPQPVIALSGGDGGAGVEGIIKVNTFRTYLDGVPQKTLFPKISRVNHACRPNSMLRFSAGGLMAGVAAFRDIEPGEEITISYIPHTDTSEERKKKLQEWGFTCSCDLCIAPVAHIDASNKRRRKLAQGIDVMVQALQRGNVRKAISVLVEALKHLQEEGLEALSGEVYESLARVYWAVGDKKKGKEHARKAVEYRADFGGVLEPTNRTKDVEIMLKGFG